MRKSVQWGAHYGREALPKVSAALREAIDAGFVDWVSVAAEFDIEVDVPEFMPQMAPEYAGDLDRIEARALDWLIDVGPISNSAEFYRLSSRPAFRIDISDGDTITVSGSRVEVDVVLSMPAFGSLGLRQI
jgi:hypothetical protein